MDRKNKLAELDAQKGAILDQRNRAILRANTQAIKRATEELRRINLQILAAGPEQEGRDRMTKKNQTPAESPDVEEAEDAITVDLQLETLSGDIRDEMLKRIRMRQTSWRMMNETEQNEEIEALGMLSRQLVRRAVALLTKHDFAHAVVTLAEFKVKSGKEIEAKITCPNIGENREALGDRTGQMCLLMMVDSEEFFGEREEPKADPDQPGFDLPVAPDEESAPKALPKPSADLQSPEDEN